MSVLSFIFRFLTYGAIALTTAWACAAIWIDGPAGIWLDGPAGPMARAGIALAYVLVTVGVLSRLRPLFKAASVYVLVSRSNRISSSRSWSSACTVRMGCGSVNTVISCS